MLEVGSITQFQCKADFLSCLDTFPTLAPYLFVFHSVTQLATILHRKQNLWYDCREYIAKKFTVPPLTTRRFSANLSYFFDFAELQTHNKNRLALHINRTNFLKATKTEESVSTPKFDGRKTNAPTRIGLYVKIMQRHSAHRASERWLREAKKRGFERGAKKCRLPVYLQGFSVAKSHILTVSSA